MAFPIERVRNDSVSVVLKEDRSPNPYMVSVFAFLSNQDLVACGNTCKHWYKVYNSPAILVQQLQVPRDYSALHLETLQCMLKTAELDAGVKRRKREFLQAIASCENRSRDAEHVLYANESLVDFVTFIGSTFFEIAAFSSACSYATIKVRAVANFVLCRL